MKGAAKVSFCSSLFILDGDRKRQERCELWSQFQCTELIWTPAWKGEAYT